MSSQLPFLMAKAHANHSKSPTFNQIQQMSTATSISEVENILLSTGYADAVNEARPSNDISLFERVLRQDFVKLLSLYQRSSPKKVAKILNAYSVVIDAENFSLIFQAVLRGNVSENIEDVITPVGKYGMSHYKRMLGVKSIENAIDFIPYKDLRRQVTIAFNKSDDLNDQIFNISTALSHYSFEALNNLIPNIMRKEIELLNLQTVCRAINLGIDAVDWVITTRGVVKKHLNRLMSFNTPQEVISYILPYFPVKSPLKYALASEDNNIVDTLEDLSLLYVYKQHHHRFYFGGNGDAALLAFFAIKKAEIEDITRLLLAVDKGISPDIVREMLYPIYSRR